MTCMFAGDTLYMFADTDLINVAGRLLDLPYALAFLATGTMALHPSMRALTEPAGNRPQASSPGRIVLVAIALLVPAVITLQHPSSSLQDRMALFVIIILLTFTAVMRIIQALHIAERSEASLAYQAMHDSLTGLPNRRMMHKYLTDVLEQASVDDTHVALLFLDLDRFKLVNDTLGHTHGDELLVAVAKRLHEQVRPSDLVTRIGGDEFMIVLGQVVSVSQALDLANRLRYSLRAPFLVNDMEFYVSASIGLAFAWGDDPNATAEVLVRDADTAMYQAKDAGRDAVAVFDQSMRTKVSERMELEHDLRRAVELRQLHLVYQPIVRIPHGPIEGVEALVRWAHPTLGLIPPARFIPLAEESGLIMGIGEWVLEEALRQLAAWRHQTTGFEDLYVAVNLSAAQLHDEGLVHRVGLALAHHGIEGSALCLELTESVVMDKPLQAAAVLTQLRSLDVRLAIDDFGTEYSSLAYLKRFPVTSLKIDRSFVDTLEDEDSSDATLIAAVVAMAPRAGHHHHRRRCGDDQPGITVDGTRLRCLAGVPVLEAGAGRRSPLRGQLDVEAGPGRPRGLALVDRRSAPRRSVLRRSRGRSAGSIPTPSKYSACRSGSDSARRRSVSPTLHHTGMLAGEPRYGCGLTPVKPAMGMRSFHRIMRNTGTSRMARSHSIPQRGVAMARA